MKPNQIKMDISKQQETQHRTHSCHFPATSCGRLGEGRAACVQMEVVEAIPPPPRRGQIPGSGKRHKGRLLLALTPGSRGRRGRGMMGAHPSRRGDGDPRRGFPRQGKDSLFIPAGAARRPPVSAAGGSPGAAEPAGPVRPGPRAPPAPLRPAHASLPPVIPPGEARARPARGQPWPPPGAEPSRGRCRRPAQPRPPARPARPGRVPVSPGVQRPRDARPRAGHTPYRPEATASGRRGLASPRGAGGSHGRAPGGETGAGRGVRGGEAAAAQPRGPSAANMAGGGGGSRRGRGAAAAGPAHRARGRRVPAPAALPRSPGAGS